MRVRRFVAGFTLIAALGFGVQAASGEEVWAVRSGRTTFHWNVNFMRDMGLNLTAVEETAPTPDEVFMEEPHWTLAIREDSDLRFRTETGIPVPDGLVGGAIRHDGSMYLTERNTGVEHQLRSPEIAYISPAEYTPEEVTMRPLYLRGTDAGSPIVCDLVHSMFDFDRDTRTLKIHYLNARISAAWAKSLNRAELAGLVIGMAEVVASVERVSSTGSEPEPYVPNFDHGVLDVSLGGLSNIQHWDHAGTYPTGTAALSMATTSCNVGTVDVPWLAPMQEDHPMIHMALYRLLNGRFEQIGVSWLKHGFYALSDNACSQCMHPSDGSFLGVGCSDTYGSGNNADRRYLGPRSEVNAAAGTWECTGSHFAGGQPDCVRRHNETGHGPLDHRLFALDADLNNAGATYFYEAYYVVRADNLRHNNWGSRRCTMSWNGSFWQFTTPSSGNALVNGPALNRFGELRTTVDIPGDGDVLLAVQTTDLGGGAFNYEYALLNLDSDRRVRSFSLPVVGVPNITNIGFHDSDLDPTNDWQVTLQGGTITWETDTYAQNPNANALEFGYMFNFRFDAGAASKSVNATLGLFEPGGGDEAVAATFGPENSTSAVQEAAPTLPTVRLSPSRPNPLDPSTTIQFDLSAPAKVKLEIFNAAGRLVRSLLDEPRASGTHQILWDGKDSNAERVGSGVYYSRLTASGAIAVQPMLVID
jgi:hypothetical protein